MVAGSVTVVLIPASYVIAIFILSNLSFGAWMVAQANLETFPNIFKYQ